MSASVLAMLANSPDVAQRNTHAPDQVVLQVYQQLAWPGLGHVQRFHLGGDLARGIIDAAFILLWKFNVGHGFVRRLYTQVLPC